MLSEHVLGVLVPTDDFKDCFGSMAHLRQCASNVLSSTLLHKLPEEWANVCHNSLDYDVEDADNTSKRKADTGYLPEVLHQNKSFTKINFSTAIYICGIEDLYGFGFNFFGVLALFRVLNSSLLSILNFSLLCHF